MIGVLITRTENSPLTVFGKMPTILSRLSNGDRVPRTPSRCCGRRSRRWWRHGRCCGYGRTACEDGLTPVQRSGTRNATPRNSWWRRRTINCCCEESAFDQASCLARRGRQCSVCKKFWHSQGEALSHGGRAWLGLGRGDSTRVQRRRFHRDMQTCPTVLTGADSHGITDFFCWPAIHTRWWCARCTVVSTSRNTCHCDDNESVGSRDGAWGGSWNSFSATTTFPDSCRVRASAASMPATVMQLHCFEAERLWHSCRDELSCLRGIMPLMLAEWSWHWGREVPAVDASASGVSVERSLWSFRKVGEVGQVKERRQFNIDARNAREHSLQYGGFNLNEQGRLLRDEGWPASTGAQRCNDKIRG